MHSSSAGQTGSFIGGEEDQEYIFSVRDNGIGIDPKDSDKIFSIYRLHSKSNIRDRIGLALCKR
jgi:light-regulated signal transduction histidine kinase (bacteriophytochrome)